MGFVEGGQHGFEGETGEGIVHQLLIAATLRTIDFLLKIFIVFLLPQVHEARFAEDGVAVVADEDVEGDLLAPLARQQLLDHLHLRVHRLHGPEVHLLRVEYLLL